MKDTTPKIKVPFTFLREQLLYQISNRAYVESSVMPDGPAKRQVADIIQDGNIDIVNETMEMAVNECKEILYPFTKTEISGDKCDNEPKAPDSYTIEANFPETFSQTTIDLLADQLNSYIVCRVLSDWLSKTYPESVPKWDEKIERLKAGIRTTLSIRRKKIRRGLSPF